MPRKKPNACAKMPPPRDSSSSRRRKKEAQKRAGILYGVAKADGEKRKAAIQRECQEEQEQLRALARSRQGQVARAAERIVLGHPRRR